MVLELHMSRNINVLFRKTWNIDFLIIFSVIPTGLDLYKEIYFLEGVHELRDQQHNNVQII